MGAHASATVQIRPADADDAPATALADTEPTTATGDVAAVAPGWRSSQWIHGAATEISELWSSGPDPMPTVWAYANRGDWCDQDATVIRLLGKAWCFAIAVPVSMAAYVTAWIAQRPGRGAATALLLFVLWCLL